MDLNIDLKNLNVEVWFLLLISVIVAVALIVINNFADLI